MSHRTPTSRIAMAAIVVAAAISCAASAASAQQRPSDLEALPPVPTDYTPKKTSWGDWDFTGIWPYDNAPAARILFQRPDGYRDRIWLTDEEHASRQTNAGKSDASYSRENAGISTQVGSQGLAEWIRTSDFSWRTSLLVSPKNGQLPALTASGEALFKAGRSGWVPGQAYDWVDDFDTWDRCITRGFPASMFPNRYNNALRIYQSPGYITIVLEMLGTRVIPIGRKADVGRHWPAAIEPWMGDARAYWEGKTLVIETTNIKSGDSVTRDTSKRAAAPVIVTMVGGAPRNTIPTSDKARAVERLTMTGPDSILYEMTYSDPEVFRAPWTAQLEWMRDESYVMPEYACHEGNVQLRNYISSSRATRAAIARGETVTDVAAALQRFERPFDVDPVAPVAPQKGSGPVAATTSKASDR